MASYLITFISLVHSSICLFNLSLFQVLFDLHPFLIVHDSVKLKDQTRIISLCLYCVYNDVNLDCQ